MEGYGNSIIRKVDKVLTGSSDVGNVSSAVPTLHSTFAIPTPEGCFPPPSFFYCLRWH
ncbi:uncharacterized protein ASPGLDRAFT_33258 [Aspergillus glaucus CBS 516.65]|uniref:Uncharacterized protein n=1 Tax=Aspergillus glaucus CBS 516.65 TaxID=1160497 RepID=A0A1L9VR11_ASPGL|nr:hypothetical protein ASPGLDRAFT_33258 [Aspergillus glaucus CBS 516.65]OJJ86347.1 hypothetical protein ASPGLDRAFT_33258 [Aspergillus glaucus CBS 516.65]